MQKQDQYLGDILIVDDTPDNLRVLTGMLTEKGYKTRPSISGSHALETINKKRPDLVLLDVVMPGLNGLELCRTLKKNKETRDIPVIFLSAKTETEDKIKGLEAGGVDYITKPFHEKEVISRVKTHMRIYQLQSKLKAQMQRFRKLTAAAFEGIVIHRKGKIIDANCEAARILEREQEDLPGKALFDFLPEKIKKALLSDESGVFDCDIQSAEGQLKPLQIATRSLGSHGESVIAMRDLSLIKHMEENNRRLSTEIRQLRLEAFKADRLGKSVARSAAMKKIYSLIDKAAGSDYPVCILGESGTGKNLAAGAIHDLSNRKDRPFVVVNCAAVAESLFEREFFGHRKGAFTGAVKNEPGYFDAAKNGTLFLDEICELPLALQAKLLRVLDEGEFTPVGDVKPRKTDYRLICATNRDIRQWVRRGKFRQDLFFRVHVLEIFIPPLRKRREDIWPIIGQIMTNENAWHKMDSLPRKFREMVRHYDWPGNVRELVNTIHRYLATEELTLTDDFRKKEDVAPGPDAGLNEAVATLETGMIRQALQEAEWNRSKAADRLKIPRRTLQRKVKRYGIGD